MLKYFTLQKCANLPYVRKILLSDVCTDLVPRAARLKSELYEKLIMLQPNSPENSKVLKVAVLGCPNSGKSSLVNMLTRWDTCAVSGKVNTTRTKQTAVLTQNDTQLCFVDLPGIIAKRTGHNFKLEKSLIRDPHVGIFESDLVICVVDVSHKSSKDELHSELMKALHFFKDKPTILVLNKIDKVKGTVYLIDIIKSLTDGVVGGKISHKDSYANRYKKSFPTFEELMQDKKTQILLEKHIPSHNLHLSDPNSTETNLINNETNDLITTETDNTITETDETESPIDESEIKNLDDEDKQIIGLLNNCTDLKLKFDFDMDDPILDVLKKQLMMKSSSKDEVAERRLKWREISEYLRISRETSWRHFEDVFAVSSVTGRGIDQLREYLVNRAKPGSWYFHSSLISDQEPETLVRMSVLANCLDQLKDEIAYKIKIIIDNYEKADDDSIHIHVTIRCKTSRQLTSVIGTRGENIQAIANKTRINLEKCFQTRVYLKMIVARDGLPPGHFEKMRKVKDFKLLYPKMASG